MPKINRAALAALTLAALAAGIAPATAESPATAETPEHAVIVKHTAGSSRAGETSASATVYCPDKTHLTGGGFEGSHGKEFTPLYSRPTEDGKGWTAAIGYHGSGRETVSVTAFAVCESE
ncbi:hypothetical protein [Streptomyces orinoci]|uniref:Secreted protein n=1 Tax=Streptomyces orinoci TaxID=67339 RepID=A0ABV3JTZ3_STRON|nr:hypothetical protein [Streptomyces orinoci]